MKKKTLKHIDFSNKKTLIRVDFNVPLDGTTITDDNRIKESLPTINYVLENGGAIILMSHLGRPKGKVMDEFSMQPVAARLSELLGKDVIMANDVVGKDAKEKAVNLQAGEILLLENLRFDAREEENNEDFARSLASLADVYVNDAFGTSHRKHASTYGVAKFLPSAIGFLIQKELDVIMNTIANPKKPFVGILGGAKISEKLTIIDKLLDICDTLIIGGGMSYTFQKAMGYEIGQSLFDESKLDVVKEMLDKAKNKNVNLLLPEDYVVSKGISDVENMKTTLDAHIEPDFMGVDIGEKSIAKFVDAIHGAKTVIWNGPLGVFETPEFANGTYEIAKAVAAVDGTTILGGGDSGSAVINMGLGDKITHISTGGGASLKLFEGNVLPGVDVIENI